ncbi:MAG TPA: MAPEG family protein [Polyangiales bacterium]
MATFPSASSPTTPVSALPTVDTPPTLTDYARVSVGLTLFAGWLTFVVQRPWTHTVRPAELLGPLLALIALVFVAWAVTLVFRNYAILRGITSGAYYRRYEGELPPEWVERPARTFNNLMQVPPMFYLVCLLMLHTGRVDAAQLVLAWTFVAARYAHACVYSMWNHLPSRFGTFLASFVTLIVLYVRFALQTADLW